MDSENDIERFDSLESGNFKSDKKEEKALLMSISGLDKIMSNQNLTEVSSDFTERLLSAALKIKSRPSNGKIFRLLILIFLPIIIISTIIVYLSTGSAENPIIVTQTLDKFNQLLQFASDSKVQQLFLIGEGIILLVIVEKIASSYRIFKHPSNS